MKTRPFGRTGLEVSEIIIGGGFVGGIVIHGDDATKQKLLDRVLEVGINWIDTAESYGQGQSETAIGALLKPLPAAQQPYISSKFSLDVSDLGDISGQIERSLTGSLKRLQRDRIDVYMLHNFPGIDGFTADDVLRSGGVVDALDKLRGQGLFDHIGFTALGDPAECLKIVDSGRMNAAQVYYNLLNPSAGHAVADDWDSANFNGLLDHCQAQNVAVMNIRTFAAGVLASPVVHGREIPVTPNAELATEQARARKIFTAMGQPYENGATLALRFGLSHPAISCVVVGLAELAHLDVAIAAQQAGPLADEQIARLKPLWRSNFTDGHV